MRKGKHEGCRCKRYAAVPPETCQQNERCPQMNGRIIPTRYGATRPQREYVPIRSPRPGAELAGIMLDNAIIAISSHWTGMRTVWCPEGHHACDFKVHGKHPTPKCKGYAPVLEIATKKVAIFELTEHAMNCLGLLLAEGVKRGMELRVKRNQGGANAKCVAWFADKKWEVATLCPDVVAIVEQTWGYVRNDADVLSTTVPSAASYSTN